MKMAKTLGDVESYGVKAFARALEVIPYTLAENAGLDPVKTVTELRKAHQVRFDYSQAGRCHVRKLFGLTFVCFLDGLCKKLKS